MRRARLAVVFLFSWILLGPAAAPTARFEGEGELGRVGGSWQAQSALAPHTENLTRALIGRELPPRQTFRVRLRGVRRFAEVI